MVSRDLCRRLRLLLHPLHHHGGVPACSPGASLGSLSDQVALILPVVLEPRLTGPGHPARPDPPLVAPRDPQEHLLDIRGVPQRVQMWHDQATNPRVLRIPILQVVFELKINYITLF